jgi:hypothetical protein
VSARRRRKSVPPPPAAPKPLAKNEPAISSIPYLAGNASETVVDALIDDPESWHRTEDGSLYYGDPAKTFVSIGDPRVPKAVNAEEAWNLVIQVGGDEAAQTLLYVMARCLGNENPLEKVRIHVNDSLSFRGLKRHKRGDFRPDQKRAEARRFRLLSDIWVTARDTVQVRSGKGMRQKNINLTSRLIDVAVESEEDVRASKSGGPMRLPSIVSADATDIPFAVRASIGEWSRPYLETPAYVQSMLHTIVQYDVTKDSSRFAMRFALAILFRRVGDRVTVAELLESARIAVPKTHLDRFKDNVEEALEHLTRDAIISGWSYEDAEEELPRTRWAVKWMAWGIRLRPAPVALKSRVSA